MTHLLVRERAGWGLLEAGQLDRGGDPTTQDRPLVTLPDILAAYDTARRPEPRDNPRGAATK